MHMGILHYFFSRLLLQKLSKNFPDNLKSKLLENCQKKKLIQTEYSFLFMFICRMFIYLYILKEQKLLDKDEHIYIYILNVYVYVCIYIYNGPGNLGSVPSCVIPMTLKMVLDTSLLNTQQYKVHIKGKVEESRERNCAHSYTSV